MSDSTGEQYTPSGVFARNYGDITRFIGGSMGFSTLYLIHPERTDGPPIASKLPSDCNEQTRRMLTRLYDLMGIIGPETFEEKRERVNEREEALYVRRVSYVSDLHDITFTEIYTQCGEQEAFRVEAEPNPIAANSAMTSVRSN